MAKIETEIEKLLYEEKKIPWSSYNTISDKFEGLLFKLNEVNPLVSFHFALDFYRPFNLKTDYYQKYIQALKIQGFNEIYTYLSESTSSNILEYRLYDIFERKLPTRLQYLSSEIKQNDFNIELNPKKTTFENDIELKSNAYVAQYLKQSYIHLILELYEHFNKNLKFAIDQDWIFTRLLLEPIPEKFNISRILEIEIPNIPENIPVVQESTLSLPEPKKKEFEVKLGDFRENPPKNILDFDKIISDPELFSKFELSLFENGIIDEKYNFQAKHGAKNLMAAIYNLLISKNYFQLRTFKPLKIVKSKDIRKFLDFRYCASLDKQFRLYHDKPEDWQELISKHRWLDKLPVCKLR